MPTTYTEILGDQITTEHLNLFIQCKKNNSKLIVGICEDRYYERYGVTPESVFEQRKLLVESIHLVDQVIPQKGRDNVNVNLKKHKIDVVCVSSIDNNIEMLYGHEKKHQVIQIANQYPKLKIKHINVTCLLCDKTYPSTAFTSHYKFCLEKNKLTKSNRCATRECLMMIS